MPVYEYTALDKTGKNTKGIIDADNPQTARQKLRSSEVFPIDLKETFAQPKDLPSGHISFSSFFHRDAATCHAVKRRNTPCLGPGGTDHPGNQPSSEKNTLRGQGIR
jgi:hypothetical protein